MTTPATIHESSGWTADASTFGARLALIRQRMGWGNVEKAARECAVPVETWRSWERDNRVPQRLTTIAMTIATKTGCDYLWLVHGPGRGSVRPPTGYAPGERVIAKIGDSRETRMSIHRAGAARPVRQTKPMRQKSRPMTPVAV